MKTEQTREYKKVKKQVDYFVKVVKNMNFQQKKKFMEFMAVLLTADPEKVRIVVGDEDD